MLNEIINLRSQIESELLTITSPQSLEQFRLTHLVKKGTLPSLMERLRDVPKEDKPIVGKELNLLRVYTENEFTLLKNKYESGKQQTQKLDITLPAEEQKREVFIRLCKLSMKLFQYSVKWGFLWLNLLI